MILKELPKGKFISQDNQTLLLAGNKRVQKSGTFLKFTKDNPEQHPYYWGKLLTGFTKARFFKAYTKQKFI